MFTAKLSRTLTTRTVASATTKVRAKSSKPAPAKTALSSKSNNLTVLAKLADLGLLSKVEELKVLSKLEQAGVLSKLESSGALRWAEESGAIKTIADPGTPGALTSVGFLLLVVAAATAYHATDNGAVLAASAVVGLLSLTAIVGGSTLERIQKL